MPENRDITRLSRAIGDLAEHLPERIAPDLRKAVESIEADILEALSGRVLRKRSGNLYRSVRARAEQDRGSIELSFKAGGSRVPYALIHEFGGSTGRATLRARPYMRPSIESGIELAEQAIGKTLISSLIYSVDR